MKKILAFVAIAIICFCFFASCEDEHVPSEETPKSDSYEYDWENHWLKTDENDTEHIPHEFDSNGKCSECGFDTFKTYQLTVTDEYNWLIYERDGVYEEFDVIKFHTYVHPIKIDMYVDGEFYSSGKQVSINEYDDYIEYTLTMPNRAVTVEFKSDLVASSSFMMLNPWLGRLQYKEIEELVIEQGFVGVNPDTKPEIITHTYSLTISRIKEALSDMKICQVRQDSELASPVEGGVYIKYTFITETESYTIYVENNRIELDGAIYLVYGDYPLE